MDKCNIFVGGVNPTLKQQFIDEFGLSSGDFPFRYLGVPLSTKRLTCKDSKGLVDRIMAKAASWTARTLSYAGRLQLVNVILTSMQSFWCQLFILPKKIIKQVQACCRSFLWTGNISLSRRALVAWESMCKPKCAGGLNIRDVVCWNKAAIMKHLWHVSEKADKLWVQWVHAYYIKGRRLEQCNFNAVSWMIRNIIGSNEVLTEIGGWNEVTKAGAYSIKATYKKLRGDFPKVAWRKLFCNVNSSPKSLFILWLILQKRLTTAPLVKSWGINVDDKCCFCQNTEETIEHLFFECNFSSSIWMLLLKDLGINRQCGSFEDEVSSALKKAKLKTNVARLYCMVFVEFIYAIWIERNARRFQNSSMEHEQIKRKVLFATAARCSEEIRSLMLHLEFAGFSCCCCVVLCLSC